MPRNVVATILKLLAACLVVGLLLAALDVTPTEVFRDMGGTLRETLDMASSFLGWALQYILLGAAVVIPIWLVIVAVNLLRGR